MTSPDISLFEDLVGVPFVVGGRSVVTGLDCFGVMLEVHRRLGYSPATPDVWGELPDIDGVLDRYHEWFRELGGSEPLRAGDVLFGPGEAPHIAHVSVAIDGFRGLTTAARTGCIIIPLARARRGQVRAYRRVDA